MNILKLFFQLLYFPKKRSQYLFTILQEKLFRQKLKKKVRQFYDYDEISSLMPGQKDIKLVKINGKDIIFQKWLILWNLKHIYTKFRHKYPNIEIGLSKGWQMSSLRPPHCVLAGSGRTHMVCVCPLHANMNFMASGNDKI